MLVGFIVVVMIHISSFGGGGVVGQICGCSWGDGRPNFFKILT